MTTHINRDTKVCGVEAFALRDAFASTRSGFVDEWLANRLKLTSAQTQKVLAQLQAEGYVERSDHYWKLTRKGIQLGHASGLKLLKRSAAERLVQQYVERIGQIRDDPYWLWEVTEARVFGSFLDPSKLELGDVDLLHGLVRKTADREEHNRLEETRRDELQEISAIYRRSYIDYLYAPSIEVEIYLRRGNAKRRNPYLSFHRTDDQVINAAPHRVLYKMGASYEP